MTIKNNKKSSKMYFKRIIACFAAAAVFSAGASEFAVTESRVYVSAAESSYEEKTSGDYTYEIREDESGQRFACIKKYKGKSAVTEIPSELDGLKVKMIGYNAFYYAEMGETLVIPEEVTVIDTYAFYGAKNLTEVIFSGGEKTIAGNSFGKISSLEKVTVSKDCAVSLQDEAFRGNSNLEEIAVEGKILKLHADAFEDTKWFENQQDGVVYVGDWALCYKGELPSDRRMEIKKGTRAIAESAFSFIKVKTVKFNDGLEYIGVNAFFFCRVLLEVEDMPESLKTIDEGAFSECLILRSADMPETLESIGRYAFSNCCSLVTAKIPSGVKTIEECTFVGCDSLYSVEIPESVSEIKAAAFKDCFMLTFAKGCEGVVSVGKDAFRGSSVKEISFSEKLTSVESSDSKEYGFSAVRGKKGTYAEKFAAENDIEFIDKDTVRRYNGEIFEVSFQKECAVITKCNDIYATKIEIPSEINGLPVKSIGKKAFFGLSELKEAVIPDSVETIGYNAFENCISLENIVIPDSVTKLEQGIFEGCGALKSVKLHSGITSIESDAFSNCVSLSDIQFPENLTAIHSGAFKNCKSLGDISLPESLKLLDGFAFDKSGIITLNTYGNIEQWDVFTFSECIGLSEVYIHEGTETIGENAFAGCSGLFRAEIAPTVKTIGNEAFSKCILLNDVRLNEGLEIIGSDAFTDTSLKSIDLPDTVTTLGDGAFAGSSLLTEINIPESLKYIGFLALDTTEWMKNYNEKNHMYYMDDMLFRCTYTSSGLYDNEPHEVEIKEGTKYIAGGAFHNCKNVKTVRIPDGVTYIGNGAFWDCQVLESICIPYGIKTLNRSVFNGCEKLTDVTLPDSIEIIETDAFEGCRELKEITIPSSVRKIALDAFIDCKSLEKVVLNEGLEEISAGAFEYDKNLKDITLPSTLKIIGDYAFYSCESLESVVIPEGVEKIGSDTFSYCKSLREITVPASVNSISSSAFNNRSDDLVIKGYTGSEAETYARKNNIKFISLGGYKEPEITTTVTRPVPPAPETEQTSAPVTTTPAVTTVITETTKPVTTTVTEKTEYTPVVLKVPEETGDLDGSGSITAYDLAGLVKWIILNESDPRTTSSLKYGDINCDGLVNMQDIILLRKVLLEDVILEYVK